MTSGGSTNLVRREDTSVSMVHRENQYVDDWSGIASTDFVTMVIANQLFGIPVLQVQDVLGPRKITRIPLAPPDIAGSLNLRGRIVTAIDVRTRLGLPRDTEAKSRDMSVVVDHKGELYSLIVDNVGEVLSLADNEFERNPATLDARWREISDGIFRLTDGLLVVIDVQRLLDFDSMERA